jgi:bacteriocin biosynthesis cyclodehydratase domain-containing protein
MPRVRLSPTAAVTATDAGVILRSDLGTFRITGADASAFLDRVLPLLDGSRDPEAIGEALAGWSRASVGAFLALLSARGLIEEVPDSPARWRGDEAFFRACPGAPADATARIARARVVVAGVEPWGAAAATELAAAGVGEVHVAGAETPVPDTGPWSLLVAAVHPGDARRIENVARAAHRAGIVSLWSHLAGTTAVLGPLTTPGRTACRICATVDALNPPLSCADPNPSRSGGPPPTPPQDSGSLAPPNPSSETMALLLGHLVALEALRAISGYAGSPLGGRLVIEDLATFESSLHTLVRLPRCRVCGDA